MIRVRGICYFGLDFICYHDQQSSYDFLPSCLLVQMNTMPSSHSFLSFKISLWVSWLCRCSPLCVSCCIGRSSKDTRSIMLHNFSSPFFFVPCEHHVELPFPFVFLCSTFFVLLVHHGGHGCALCFPFVVLCCIWKRSKDMKSATPTIFFPTFIFHFMWAPHLPPFSFCAFVLMWVVYCGHHGCVGAPHFVISCCRWKNSKDAIRNVDPCNSSSFFCLLYFVSSEHNTFLPFPFVFLCFI